MNRRRVSTPSLPYASATSGKRAIISIHKILEVFGVSDISVMETSDGVLAHFKWRERVVMVRPSAAGYAANWRRRHPHSRRMRTTEIDYERRALQKGRTAVYSMLHDWIKGQVTAIETGMLSFEGAFLGQIMLPTGETVLERVERNHMLNLPPPSRRTDPYIERRPWACDVAEARRVARRRWREAAKACSGDATAALRSGTHGAHNKTISRKRSSREPMNGGLIP